MVGHLNNTVYCKLKPSSVHGIGVFAIRDIPKGTKVTFEPSEIEIETLTEEEMNQLVPEVRDEILDRTVFVEGEPLAFISPNSACNFRSYMNHSDEPNTNGVVALRDIHKGEELTEDFRTMGPVHPLTKNHMQFLWS